MTFARPQHLPAAVSGAPAHRAANSLDVAALPAQERPVFCISPSALQAQAKLFLDGFPGEVAYAVKANPGDEVIKALHAGGIEVFDVASTVEMATVTRLCGKVELHYHNPRRRRSRCAAGRRRRRCPRTWRAAVARSAG